MALFYKYFQTLFDSNIFTEFFLILIGVGILTGIAKDREYWWLPSAFLIAGFIGGFIGIFTSIDLGISIIILPISIFILGIIIAFNLNIPSELVSIVLVIFGFLNGHNLAHHLLNLNLPFITLLIILLLSTLPILIGYIITKYFFSNKPIIDYLGWSMAIVGLIVLAI